MPSPRADAGPPCASKTGVAACGLAFGCALCFVLYLPALSGPLLLDDTTVLAPLLERGAADHGWLTYLFSDSGPLGRPLAMVTFAANAALNGDGLWYWKATNALIHMAIGVALFALFTELFYACGSTVRSARAVALFGALIWLVHPLHVSTVMYTVQRMTQLSALFCVLGMLAYVRGRVAYTGGRRHGFAICSAFFVFTPLAALSKETGLLLPLFLAAIEWTVFASSRHARPHWLVWVFVAGLLVPYGVAAAYLLSDVEKHVLGAYAIRDFTLLERLLTQARVLVSYLKWIIVPRQGDMGFYHDDIRVSQSFIGEPDTIAAVAVLSLMFAGAYLLRARAPLVALGILLFFVGQALESTLFGLELMVEHRNYLPSAGIVLIGCGVAVKIDKRRLAALAGMAIVLVFAGATALRAQLWGEEGGLYRAFLQVHPTSVRARVTLAEWQTVRGDFSAALATLDGAESIALAVHGLRVHCARDGTAGTDAARVFDAVGETRILSNFTVDTLIFLAGQTLDGHCFLNQEHLSLALQAAAERPIPAALGYRSSIYAALLRHRLGDSRIAREMIKNATAGEPFDPFPWYLLAEWAADARDLDAARSFLLEARKRAAAGRRDYSSIDAAVAEIIDP
ncbi:MAG: hypothetical protein O7B81_13180 [Gammaproteobacteria bacterium]|nr:hypothetical protein [Gammaproteobacteria bacterium]